MITVKISAYNISLGFRKTRYVQHVCLVVRRGMRFEILATKLQRLYFAVLTLSTISAAQNML